MLILDIEKKGYLSNAENAMQCHLPESDNTNSSNNTLIYFKVNHDF